MPTTRSPALLFLCHTPLDGVGGFNGSCGTSGLPITVSTLRLVSTLDVDRASRPEFAADFSQPLPAAQRRAMASRFDVATTMCCPFDVFVRPDGKGLVGPAWDNVAAALRPGGYFLFTTAQMGMDRLKAFLGLPKSRRGPDVMAALGRHIDAQPLGLRYVPLGGRDAEAAAFERWHTELLRQHGTRVFWGRAIAEGPTWKELRKLGIVVFRKEP